MPLAVWSDGDTWEVPHLKVTDLSGPGTGSRCGQSHWRGPHTDGGGGEIIVKDNVEAESDTRSRKEMVTIYAKKVAVLDAGGKQKQISQMVVTDFPPFLKAQAVQFIVELGKELAANNNLTKAQEDANSAQHASVTCRKGLSGPQEEASSAPQEAASSARHQRAQSLNL